jgi:hypothetical protein
MTGSAKQSISSREERMDCFASLAMTVGQKQKRRGMPRRFEIGNQDA